MMSAQPHHYTTTGSLTPTGGEGTMREVDRRQASSTIVREEYIGAGIPEGQVRYVEVPEIREVITRVPKKEIIEREQIVPKYEIQYVDRIVEIPETRYVDKQVEIPQIVETVRTVPRHEVIEVPKEVVRHVPRIETVTVEKMVEVPGEIIEIPKPYTVENKVPVPRFVDNEVAMVVAQTIKPIITESNETVEVDVLEYEPQVVVVDVHVPKPVSSQLIAAGMIEEVHRLVTVPAAQYNSMLKVLNVHISESDQRSTLPFITESNGVIPMLHGHEANLMYPAPIATAQIQGWVAGSGINSIHQFVQTRQGQVISPMRPTTTSYHQTSSSSKLPGRVQTSHSGIVRHHSSRVGGTQRAISIPQTIGQHRLY